MSSRVLSYCLLGALALSASGVRAEGASTAAAEVLFQEGRKLFKAGNTAEACPKLAESQRLDPATGTLLALALCHEQEKKIASAWAEFTDVEAQARRAGRKDRESLAHEHAAALRPRLSTLTLDVSAQVAQISGLEVRVDGDANGSGSWGVAVPVNGGEHLVDASAPGRVSWSKRVSIKRESEAARVVIPALEKSEAKGASEPASAASGDTAPDGPLPHESDVQPSAPSEAKSGSGLRLAGAITAGAGLVTMGVSGVVMFLAKSKYNDATKACTDGHCTSTPYHDVEAARSQGTLATVLVVAGGVVTAGGAAMWFFAPRNREQAHAEPGPRIERVGVGPGSVVVGGRF